MVRFPSSALSLGLLLALGVSVAQATHAQSPVTELMMQSQPGDYIGQGQDYDYTTSTTNFSAYLNQNDGYVDINYGPKSGDFTDPNYGFLDFSTVQLGQALTAGYYGDAQRAAFAAPGHPGLDVTIYGRGSNTVTGNFTILESSFTNDPTTGAETLNSFAVQFEQHSEGDTPALFGTLYYNYVAPAPAPETSAGIGMGIGVAALGALALRRKQRAA